jgi:hypothetical protein
MSKVPVSAHAAIQQARDAVQTPADGARLLALMLWHADEPPNWHAPAARGGTDPVGADWSRGAALTENTLHDVPRAATARCQVSWKTRSPLVRDRERHGYFGDQGGLKRQATVAAFAADQPSTTTRSAS